MQLILSIVFLVLASLFIISLAAARKRAARIVTKASELDRAITALETAISETQKRVAKPQETSPLPEHMQPDVIQAVINTKRYKGIELLSGPHLIQRVRDIRKTETNYNVYLIQTKSGPFLLHHRVSEATDYFMQYERIGSMLEEPPKPIRILGMFDDMESKLQEPVPSVEHKRALA